MWKWSCPATSTFVSEYHTEQRAREGLAFHVLGPEFFGVEDIWNIGTCHLEHEVVDDLVPCEFSNCKIEYVPKARKIGAYGRIVD